jgi:hypothetical protein
VGVSEFSIEENVARLSQYLDVGQLPADDLRWFKHATEDAKTYYLEALTAQPGSYDERLIYQTLWHETQLGAGLAEFYAGFRAHPRLHSFARIVLPRSAINSSTGPKIENHHPDSQSDTGKAPS